MRIAPCCLSLLLLTAGARPASAQPAPAVAPVEEALAPVVTPPARPGATPAAATAPARSNRGPAGRMMGEMLAGVGAGLGGALLGGLLGYAAHTFASQGDPGSPTAAIGVGAGVGWMAALPLGVTLFGAAREGDGGYGWALLGAAGGTAVGGLFGYALDRGPRDGLAGAAAVGFFGGVVGALLGYELSCTGGLRGRPEPSRPVSRRWQPGIAVDARGAWASVGGHF